MPGYSELSSNTSLIMNDTRIHYPDRDIAAIHIHTDVSGDDGILTPEQVVERAAALGITEVGLTAHNSFEASERGSEYARKRGLKILVPRAMEVTTRDWSSHLIVYDVKGDVKPDRTIKDTIRETHDQGGLVIPTHIGYGQIVPSLSAQDLIHLKEEGFDIDACEAGVAWADEIPFISSVDLTARAYGSLEKEIRGPEIAGSDSHDDTFIQALTLIPKGLTLNEAVKTNQTTPVFTGIKGRKRFHEHLKFIRKCLAETTLQSLHRVQNRLGKISRHLLFR